jgi:hypothetical protein
MKFTILIILVLVVFSCEKAEDRRCFKSVGNEIVKEIPLGDITKLYLQEQIVYTLVQDSINKVVLRGGENIVSFIAVEETEEGWEIKNNNRCDFLRSYKKKIHAEIHFKESLNYIRYEGSENLTCKDTLNLASFTMLMRDGAGSIDLKIKTGWLDVGVTSGFADFTIHGTADYARLSIKGNGYGNAYELKIRDSIHVVSESPGVIKLNADNILFKSEIWSLGDIWYRGNPMKINTLREGKGHLIQKD